ncbi:Reverse transcriptase domain [Arabidopsis thaliana x Arabidopsis arenosa]|uniref:Reverse transcriptase domain n=1 Tax=Arabidopsis thaliana x Arabidopsis arenosa TaxID=1240361 RepID=A0A8T1ZK32_9BRAS|nr:Reverse transcriptase domain [Arabidopsis thaliana x Arabidopsis arenosa]
MIDHIDHIDLVKDLMAQYVELDEVADKCVHVLIASDHIYCDAVQMLMGLKSTSGGIWLLWRSGIGEMSIIESTEQFIAAKLQNETEVLNIVVVYAAPSATRRSGLWENLSRVVLGLEGPLIIGGDFNTIVRVDERSGEDTFVAKRLDRVMCCAHARLKWQEARVTHLPFLASDHAPLYVQLSPAVGQNRRRRPFRFEAAWLSHPSFKDLVRASWNGELQTPMALDELKEKLQQWNKDVFGDVQKKKEVLMRDIKAIQDELELVQTDSMLRREEELVKEFEVILEQEEILLFQKSREKWIALGDRNTTYFHTSTIIRRRRNRIEMLRNNEEHWVSDPQELEKLAVDYYQRLYSLDDVPREVERLPPEGFAPLTREEKVSLNKPFTAVEIEAAIRSMGSFKAPGPDGFQPIFYQKCWETVGSSVIRVISKLIGPAQSSFIPGRLSIDNIVVVQEAVHSMRRKKGRKGWMLLKLDLEKAYDRIRWDFLEDTIRAAGFEECWVQWIIQCVTGPSMSILWNGEKTDAFKPSRGLRQGDPLSPYLFVLCLERLCHMIDRSIAVKDWKPICLSQGGGARLSHICFADDLILFAEASVAQIRVIRRVLEKFCVASGQKVSLEKSKKFFSENVSRELGEMISNESGIKATKELGKYLGMPILQKRINKDTFGEVLERVTSKLAGWKGRSLSFAGRLTLTKSVLSSIPVHVMSTILLPKSITEGLDKVSRAFLWGSTTEKKKQHLIAWNRVCQPRGEGGLGLRKAKDMNKALVSKVGWRLMNETKSLWANVLRKKYKVGSVQDQGWLAARRPGSSTWRSIVTGLREVGLQGSRWVLGNGRDIRFWTDKWLCNEPLVERVIMELPNESLQWRVKDLWQEGTGWCLDAIVPYVTINTRLELAAIVVDNVTGSRDRLAWGETADGQFTVKSAYTMITRDESPKQDMASFYNKIWKVKAPERVKTFLWLVSHQAIMTNVERFRRHIGDTTICQVCKGGEETIIHVLRDCPSISGIWSRLVPDRRKQEFFNASLLTWLHGNLRGGEATGDYWAKEVHQANEIHRVEKNVGGRVERRIAWQPPLGEWVKLNTDGASRGNPGLAAAGGALRDGTGRWRGGFVLNIGICSAPLAELWGVYYGLYIAWERRITRLELEVDSELVVGFLKSGISDSHPLSFLVRLCHGFLTRDWIVRISHVYREANRLADGLANYAFTLPLGIHLFEVAPSVVETILLEDSRGTSFPRSVRLYNFYF